MFGKSKENKKIEELLCKIRADYELLVSDYNRPRSLIKQFEWRYHDAVEYRVNLSNFLAAEDEAVKALLQQAIDQKAPAPSANTTIKTDAAPRTAKVGSNDERISFADKLIQEFTDRIQKYPEIIIHPDAAFEMKKLFGALSCMEQDYWGTVDRIVRNMAGSRRFTYSVDLDPEINRMCNSGKEGIPSELTTYYRLLERMPRDYGEIEREEKRCLVKAAGLLKRLQMEIIRTIDQSGALNEEEITRLNEAKDFIEGMIEDFRLKDLARLV